MAIAELVSAQVLAEHLGKTLREGMLKAAEPIVQRALKDVEQEMRNQLAAMIAGQLEHGYSMERFGQELRISVHLLRAELSGEERK